MNRRHFGKLAASAAITSACLHASSQLSATPPRFSFMLWALEKQAPFDQCLQWVSDAGYQGVELVGEFQQWSPAQTSAFLQRLHTLHLIVDAMSGVKAGFAVPQQTAAFRSQLMQHIEAATRLQCTKIILLSGARVEGLHPDQQRQTAIDNLKWAADRAAAQHIDIVIEPIDLLENPSIYMASVAQGFEIARAVDHPNLKVLYDFYHEQRSFGNLIEKLGNNIDLVGLVHIADVPGRHEPGTGEIDFDSIYRKLASLHYAHWIAMEYYPTQPPVASLTKSRIEAQRALVS